MTDPQTEAWAIAERLMLPDEDVFNLAVDIIATALAAKDAELVAVKTSRDEYAKDTAARATENFRLRAQLAELAAENERLKQRLANHPRDTNRVESHETANVSDKPEGQQEPVAWMWEEVVDPTGDVIRGGTITRFATHWSTPPSYAVVTPLYTRPSEQAVTEEWREIKQHVQPRIADGYTAVAISKPGYWFVKGPGPAAALKAAMEAERHD